MLKVLLIVAAWIASALASERMCRAGEPERTCQITGEGCDAKNVTFLPYNLTLMRWNSTLKSYNPKPAGELEAHVAVGGEDDWQMYLHGPMMRPWRERGPKDSLPPFYVQATWTNKVYRFENLTREGGIGSRGKPMTAVQKVVAHAIAPSTSYPIEDKNGDMKGLLVAEGQPFLISAPFDPKHTEMDFGGVDYIKDWVDTGHSCSRIFPNAIDKVSHYKSGGDVVNTVSCHPTTGICFFSVWKFYDDQAPLWNNLTRKYPDCLHYCVVDDLEQMSGGCKKAGVVKDEFGEQVCSKHGVGAVHGMTVAFGPNLTHSDPNEFDIFLVFTGGATFVGGESSMQKVKCKKDASGDLTVIKSEAFARDLFETSVGRTSGTGMAEKDVGGDHAWADESGKYVWISTFRMPNAGVHMVDYQTGELIYSIKGSPYFLPKNYAYSAGIHGTGWLGDGKGVLVLGTSACTHPETACAPVPWNPITKVTGLEARGLMYVIDISEILPPPESVEQQGATTIVV